MLTLWDFYAAKAAIARRALSREAALASLRAANAAGGERSWLSRAAAQGELDTNLAREIHSHIEKAEYFRAEALYTVCALKSGVPASAIQSARERRRQLRYRRRLGDLLCEGQLISRARHEALVAEATAAFLRDTENRLVAFRGALAGSAEGLAMLSSSAQAFPSEAQLIEFYRALPVTSPHNPFVGAEDEDEQDMPADLIQTMNLSQRSLARPPSSAIEPGDEADTVFLPTSGEFWAVTDSQASRSIEQTIREDAPQTLPRRSGATTAKLPGASGGNTIAEQNMALLDSRELAVVLASKYRLLGLLGQGNMGKVFRAESLEDARIVALKVAQPKGRRSEEVRRRFKREIAITSLMSSPHVIEVYDADEFPDGSCYMAMQLLEGPSLHEYLHDKTRLSVEETLAIAEQVCHALIACHEKKVVHRDLKPENLHVTDTDDGVRITLMDFGLSRWLSEEELISEQIFTTVATTVSGSPNYMAPESIEDPDKVDARCDLYSLGCTIFELLTGEPPFIGKSVPEIMELQLYAPVPALIERLPQVHQLPEGLEPMIRRLLEKERSRRYQSAGEVLAAIRDLRQNPTRRLRAAAPTQKMKRKSFLARLTSFLTGD